MAQQTVTPRSHIQCIGSDRSRCGYCHSQHSSHNFGAWAHTLDVRDYQAMLDAGWRRSGSYLYRPYMATTCCPSYVIRLDATRYSLSSTHKRVLKRLKRFVEKAEGRAERGGDVDEGDTVPMADIAGTVGIEVESCQSRKKSEAVAGRPGLNREEMGNEGSAGALEEKEEMQRAIGIALDEAVGEGTLRRDVVEVVRKKVKVYPSRVGAGKKKKIRGKGGGGSENCHPGVGVDAKKGPFASNVALLIAATERRQDIERSDEKEGVGRNTKSATGSSKQRRLGVKELERQMEIAGVIAKGLGNWLSGVWNVSVSSPGFLNFESGRPEMNDSQMEREITTKMRKQQSGDRTPRGDWNNGLQRKKEAFNSVLAASRARLSRVGSEVSADRGTETVGEARTLAPTILGSSLGKPEEWGIVRPRAEKILDNLGEGESFTMELVPAQFIADAFEVFRKYQIAIHHEEPSECTEETYRRFLVDSPLVQRQSEADPEQVYGSFHILYRMRGRLFAVGVVDILPRCLSSVYLFYDPDFGKLSPGTLSALKEIEWIRQAAAIYPNMQFYYMGYYIHSCPKMRYKAGFHPSELLCEKTRLWVGVSEAQKVLDNSTLQFTRLAPPDAAPGSDLMNFMVSETEEELLIGQAHIRIELEGDGTHFVTVRSLGEGFLSMFPREMATLRKKIRTFIGLVGKESSPNFSHWWF